MRRRNCSRRRERIGALFGESGTDTAPGDAGADPHARSRHCWNKAQRQAGRGWR